MCSRFILTAPAGKKGESREVLLCPTEPPASGTGPPKHGLERIRTSKRELGMAQLIVTAKSNEMYEKRGSLFDVSDRVRNIILPIYPKGIQRV